MFLCRKDGLRDRGNYLIGLDNYLEDNVNYPNAAYLYEQSMLTENYDFANIGAHGDRTSFSFTGGSIVINNDWAKTHDIKPLYLWDGSCSTGQMDMQRTIPCLLSTFLYNPNNNVIIAKGATAPQGGLGSSIYDNNQNYFYIGSLLSQGFSFGEAIVRHMNSELLPSFEKQKEYFGSQSILFGDGTLMLQEFHDGTVIVSSPPVLEIIAPSSITTNSATLNGTINPNGASTTYYFEYGTTISYGSVTPASDAGSGTTKKTIAAKLTGLVANTVYHFRLVGQNSVGTKYGNDYTFETSAGTLPESFTSYKILTEQSSQLTVNYGEYIKVFGSAGVNTINVESGGRLACVNFVGANVLNIEDSSSNFTIYRSGAAVYLENSTKGTLIKIPATKTGQILNFGNNADDSFELIITNGKVMLGNQEIMKTKIQL